MVSVPNAITVVRTVVAMGLAVWAGYTGSVPVLVAAYIVYWFGDMADGQAARRMNQETRLVGVKLSSWPTPQHTSSLVDTLRAFGAIGDALAS